MNFVVGRIRGEEAMSLKAALRDLSKLTTFAGCLSFMCQVCVNSPFLIRMNDPKMHQEVP